MRNIRLALLTLLLPALALAQGTSTNCRTPNVTCKAAKFVLPGGGKLDFNADTGVYLRYAGVNAGISSDGYTVTFGDIHTASGFLTSDANATVTITSSKTNGANAVGFELSTLAFTTSSTRLLCIDNNGVKKLCLSKDGYLLGTFATPQLINLAYADNGIQLATGSVLGGDVVVTDLNGVYFMHINKDGITQSTTENPVPVVHAAQTANPVAMEFGRATASVGGALAVTFATAFGAAPSCVCTDENAVPVICGITTAPSTSAVTFSITAARADTLDWHCTGAK